MRIAHLASIEDRHTLLSAAFMKPSDESRGVDAPHRVFRQRDRSPASFVEEEVGVVTAASHRRRRSGHLGEVEEPWRDVRHPCSARLSELLPFEQGNGEALASESQRSAATSRTGSDDDRVESASFGATDSSTPNQEAPRGAEWGEGCSRSVSGPGSRHCPRPAWS